MGDRLHKIMAERTPHQPTRFGFAVVMIVALICCMVTPGIRAQVRPVVPPETEQNELRTSPARSASQQGYERARQFDASPVFVTNGPWMNPRLDHLSTVEFTHRMQPVRLDERFSWRRGTACGVEVVHQEGDGAGVKGGYLWLLTADDRQWTLPPNARYPKEHQRNAQHAKRERLLHLMGTRMNCVAQDWGRHPDGFELADVRPGEQAGQTVLTLYPRRTPEGERYVLNVGTMFHSTSWSYLHHLGVRNSRLIVDDTTHRVVKEIDDLGDGQRAILEFKDWHDIGSGQAVPLSVEVSVPSKQFHCEYRFQWLQGTWLLQSGKSWFEGHEPQSEQITDIRWNVDDPVVDQHFADLSVRRQVLEQAPDTELQKTTIEAIPFELGQTVKLRWDRPNSPAGAIQEARFTYNKAVQLELPLGKATAEPAQLVLYDSAGQPVHVFAVPIGAADLLRRPATDFASRIADGAKLWLNPSREKLPEVRYTFHESGEKQASYSTSDATRPHLSRGVSMSLALDRLVQKPEDFRIPVHFEASLHGRPVEVAIIAGPTFVWMLGNGVAHSWKGYTSSVTSSAIVVIDRQTSRPLMEIHGDTVIHFLDYVEAAPGQSVPTRIVFRSGTETPYDFRFQVIDGKVWLFDRSMDPQGNQVVFVDQVQVAGADPRQRLRNAEAGKATVPAFDWNALSQRRLLADADHPVAQRLAMMERPMDDPNFGLLTKMKLTGEHAVIDLGSSLLWCLVRSWSLVHVDGNDINMAHRVSEGVADKRKTRASAVAIAWDRKLHVHIPARGIHNDEASPPLTLLRSIRCQRVKGRVTVAAELVSRKQYTEFWSVIAGVLWDEQGRPIASAERKHVFRVVDEVYSADITLDFGTLPEGVEPTHLSIGVGQIPIGRPMGSMWGRIAHKEPIFPVDGQGSDGGRRK